MKTLLLFCLFTFSLVAQRGVTIVGTNRTAGVFPVSNGTNFIPGAILAGANVTTTFDGTNYTIASSGGGGGGVTSLTLTQPAAGITITGSGVPITTTGTPTFSLANDLAALEALAGTNTLYYRNGVDSWTNVTIGAGMTFSGGTLNSVSGGSGTVTSVSVVTANGVSGSVANATTTPAITLTFGAIAPTSVNSIALAGVSSATLTVTGPSSFSGNSSGNNTGDQTTVTGNAGSATILQTGRTIGITGDATWTSPSFNGSANVTAAATVTRVNGVTINGTPSSGQVPIASNGTTAAWGTPSGTGDVVGPSSATDNAVVRFDTTTGKLIQNSVVTIDDSGNISGIGTLTATNFTVGTLVVTNSISAGSFVGPLTGNAATVTFADAAGDTTTFVALGTSATGSLAPATDAGLTYNATTDTLTTTTFVGALTGAASGSQPLDSDLTTIAGLTATTDNFLQSKSSAWASRTVAQVSTDLQGTGLITDAVGFRTIPQNSQSTAYTLVAADSGKHIYHPSADTTARVFTIPANASVAYPVGTAITIVNDTSAGVITISITSDTLILAGAGTTGSRTLAANGVCTIIKITSTRWIISGTGLT